MELQSSRHRTKSLSSSLYDTANPLLYLFFHLGENFRLGAFQFNARSHRVGSAIRCVPHVTELQNHLVLGQRSRLIGENVPHLAQILAQTAAIAVNVLRIVEHVIIWELTMSHALSSATISRHS